MSSYSHLRKTAPVVFICLVYLCIAPAKVVAQIDYMTPADVKAETKRSKKEAARLETEYQSHLNITKRKYKRGEGVAPAKRNEGDTDYNSDKEKNLIDLNMPAPAEPKKKKSVKKPKKK